MERLTAVALLDGFRNGTLSVLDYAERIIQRQGILKDFNHFTIFDADKLRDDAKKAQEKYTSGDARPLEGLFVAFKDNIAIQGQQNSGATKAFWGRSPKNTAEVASKLLNAGAINAGRTNMHELAYGVTSDNAFTGPVRNFYNMDHNSGGSSAGSAAAVSADVVPCALGTDTAGVINAEVRPNQHA